MNKKIKNTFWFRHYLMCSKMANMMISAKGWDNQNFAQLTIESEDGRYGNNQMIIYFTMADRFLAELHCDEEGLVFDYLEEDGILIDKLAELSEKEMEDYYHEYCIGRIDFSNLINNE